MNLKKKTELIALIKRPASNVVNNLLCFSVGKKFFTALPRRYEFLALIFLRDYYVLGLDGGGGGWARGRAPLRSRHALLQPVPLGKDTGAMTDTTPSRGLTWRAVKCRDGQDALRDRGRASWPARHLSPGPWIRASRGTVVQPTSKETGRTLFFRFHFP